jgi:NADPH-dependent 2,4-dienoyl-CoA reductase/sulfur reductase-like enzyme/rhodanese-related sulfurtransferase
MGKKVVIVGGVAGGATCAARLRRMDESAEILLLDRGPYVSFANCGLPYYVGDIIKQDSKLLLASPALFRDRFHIEVRTRHEVLSIDRAARTVHVRDLETGREYSEPYDALVLSPGAAPICPPWPGVDLAGIFTLRSVPDSRAMRAWIEEKKPAKAVVVGGGFIGLEMAENLVHRGIEVTLVEMAAQVMPPLDPEMAEYAKQRLLERGVNLALKDAVSEFRPAADGGIVVCTQSGAAYQAGMVVLAIGVRPETGLARAAGLEIGERGGIRVNEQMLSSDPAIWAVGDAVEVRNRITGQWELIPLAGPANRQGRIAADVICGREAHFNGVLATAVCGFFDLTVAMTGATEKSLRRAGIADYECVYLHPSHHVGYYPGAQPMHLKLLFRQSDGRLLGAQAAGGKGVERRIDVIATAMQMNATVHDLEEVELCYAPQFGAAKDAVNMAGMIAANVLRGDAELAPWAELGATQAFLLDVREPAEFKAGAIPGAVNIPLGQLRARLNELPHEREIWINCGVGQRAYYACRILTQAGLRARNLSGGISTYKVMHP